MSVLTASSTRSPAFTGVQPTRRSARSARRGLRDPRTGPWLVACDNRVVSAAPKHKPKARGKRTPKEEVRLTGDRIVVENPEDGERKTRAGLLIPATAAPAPKRCVWGEVALVGPDVRAVRAGDRILYLPQAGLEVELDGREYLLLRERDVQAIASPANGQEAQPGQYL